MKYQDETIKEIRKLTDGTISAHAAQMGAHNKENKMRIIPINEAGAITNMEQLPHGTGARYLECMTAHRADLPLIAVRWRRTVPARFEVLVDFCPNTEKCKPLEICPRCGRSRRDCRANSAGAET